MKTPDPRALWDEWKIVAGIVDDSRAAAAAERAAYTAWLAARKRMRLATQKATEAIAAFNKLERGTR